MLKIKRDINAARFVKNVNFHFHDFVKPIQVVNRGKKYLAVKGLKI